MSYFLERLIGSSRNEQVPLIGNRMTIGRSVDSSIQILSPMVSRCHAILTFENNQWTIKDVKSINGIYVNGTRLLEEEKSTLSDKDVISLGPPDRAEFCYCYCKCPAETDILSEFERPCKIKKREKFQSTSDVCTEKNVENLISFENLQNHESNLHVETGYTVSNNNNKNHTLVECQTSSDIKLTLPEADNALNENVCKDLKSEIKTVESLQLTSEKINSAENLYPSSNKTHQKKLTPEKFNSAENLCPSSNETNSENLKVTVESLRQLLASKEKEQEDLQDKLLRAEAQLIENQHFQSKNQDNEKSIQEKSKTEVMQQVGDIMETELICGICTELFVEAVTLNCSHTFCKYCIKKWKQKKRICPICRSSIKTETQALVLDNFIEKMVENLSTEMKEHRKKLVEERRISSSSSTTSRSEAYIVISDIDSEESYDSDFNDPDSDFSDSSIEGMPWAYYGGYGRCYTCGRRGHWANGCPDM